MLEEVLGKADGCFAINNDSIYTFSASVTLDNNVKDAELMRFSNNGTNWSDWEDYAAAKNWTLASGHNGKTVYGEFHHSSGNILQSSDAVTPLIEEKITASDGTANDFFSGMDNPGVHGSPLSISSDGSTIIVGAPRDNGDQGSVYIFRWNGSTWNENKLTASDGASTDYFGYSAFVSADGHTFAVGAPGAAVGSNADQGAVYVF